MKCEAIRRHQGSKNLLTPTSCNTVIPVRISRFMTNKNPAPEYCYILRDGTFYMVSWPSKGLDPGGLSPTSCHIMFRGTTRIETDPGKNRCSSLDT